MLGSAIPLFVTTALLLCADPVSSNQPGGESASEAPRFAEALRAAAASENPVVASSPLPATYGIGSHFGYRTSLRTGRRTFHAGADFLGPRGTPVFAVRGGIVEHVTTERGGSRRFAGYGNAVVIHHPDLGVWTFYAHLGNVEVEEGQVVEPGQPIGVVGNTTNGRFPGMPAHLHFEVRHARADGTSPFPGAYRDFNVDPSEFLASLGVRFDNDHASSDSEPLLVVAACDDHAHM
ncbi:MAG: M23 family metallopeptidase [Sandaracinaceae bacterium]